MPALAADILVRLETVLDRLREIVLITAFTTAQTNHMLACGSAQKLAAA